MTETLVVSDRGQLTLPARIRKRLGIKPGDVIVIEERHGGLLLRPAAVIPVEIYSDEQVREWDREDRFEPGEREALLKKL